MSKYKTPKSFGSYITQSRDLRANVGYQAIKLIWTEFMWQCHLQEKQPHTLVSYKLVLRLFSFAHCDVELVSYLEPHLKIVYQDFLNAHKNDRAIEQLESIIEDPSFRETPHDDFDPSCDF